LGSVLGREFAYDMISALAGLEEEMLQSSLGQLVVDVLLYQRRPLLEPLLVHGVGFRGEDDLAAGAKILQGRQGDLAGLSTRSASSLTALSSASTCLGSPVTCLV
jgi:hypothetical protein